MDSNPVTQVFYEDMELEVHENGARRVYRQRHASRMVFPQELRSLVALAGGFELCEWFYGFRRRLRLDEAHHPLLMVVVLGRSSRADPGAGRRRRRQVGRHGGTSFSGRGRRADPVRSSLDLPRRDRRRPGDGPPARRSTWSTRRALRRPRHLQPTPVARVPALDPATDEPVDRGFFAAPPPRRARLSRGRRSRRRRCVCWSEADGLPGLVVGRDGPVTVVQCLTVGTARATGGSPRPRRGGPGCCVPVDDSTAARIEGFKP